MGTAEQMNMILLHSNRFHFDRKPSRNLGGRFQDNRGHFLIRQRLAVFYRKHNMVVDFPWTVRPLANFVISLIRHEPGDTRGKDPRSKLRGITSSTMEDLANVLKLDPAISARLLRIVNSTLYGFPKQIDTISRAVNIVGMQAINDLVTGTIVGNTFSGMPNSAHGCLHILEKKRSVCIACRNDHEILYLDDSEGFFIVGCGISAIWCSTKLFHSAPSLLSSKRTILDAPWPR